MMEIGREDGRKFESKVEGEDWMEGRRKRIGREAGAILKGRPKESTGVKVEWE